MRGKPAVVLTLGAVLGSVLTLAAQPQPAGKQPGDARKQFAAATATMAAPTEAHKALAPLVGEFDQETEVKAAAEPITIRAVEKGQWILGGRFVRIESISAPDEDIKGERMLVYGYDPKAKKYTLWGIESFSLTSFSGTGDYDAASKTFKFEGERDVPGGKAPFVWTLHIGDGGAFSHDIAMKPPGAPDFVPVVSIKHTPKKK